MSFARRVGDAGHHLHAKAACGWRAIVGTIVVVTVIGMSAAALDRAASLTPEGRLLTAIICTTTAAVIAVSVRAANQQRRLRDALSDQVESRALAELALQTQRAECDSLRQRLAVESAEKDAFVRSTAHDLAAPLRNISGMAAALLLKHADELSPDAVRRLHRIRANADTERTMINDLMELARLKAPSPRDEPVDLDAIVSDLSDVFESDLARHGIDLRIDGRLPTVRGDRTRLRQVFQNLIDNSIKYMGDTPVRQIRIGGAIAPAGVTCYVSDTGGGIDPADRSQLFNLFRRGRSTVTASQPGMGLGLAGVKSIIESHDGTISYRANDGGGSVFTFTLGPRFIGTEKSGPLAKAGVAS